jgi:uncharacterized membrane protein
MNFLFDSCCSTTGHLAWSAPTWVCILAVVGGLLVWAVSLLPLRPVRYVESAAMALAVAAVIWALCGPEWVDDGERLEEGRLIVLVDGSRSMDVLEADGRPRSAAVASLLDRIGPAEVYTFGDRLRAGAPTAFQDGDTDLGGALDGITRKYAGERLGGIVVLSDGIDRGGLRKRLSTGAAVGESAGAVSLNGPLTVYGIGDAQGRTDLAVDAVRAGSFAFLRAPFPMDVDVRAIGTIPAQVTVSLTRDGQPAGSAVAQLNERGEGTAHFSLNPDRAGRFLYEASVPLPAGDAVPANQQMGLAVQVVRDRVRVLQVCGSPSWDQKFLRLFLKEDPAVDLVSFFILRTSRDMNSGYSPDELSLIEFPYQNLFDRELSTFDLVIFQNFDYRPYFESRANELLGNVAAYVKNGGAFVMLGGDRSFDLGSYAGTPIADILPMRLGVEGGGVDERLVVPKLTESGARHPVTQLTGESSDNALAWTQLGPLDGVNTVVGAADGAAVLLEHPTLKAVDGRPMPVLAVAEVGKGRSMALTSDASWRWSFAGAGAGQGNQAYLRFWKGAMRWLIGDAADAPVTVETARENYSPGEAATALVRVRSVAFSPLAGVSVEARLSGPEGEQTLQANTDADGTARFELPTDRRGAHRIRVRAVGAGLEDAAAETVYGVTSRDPELDQVEPDIEFLKALSAQAGGTFVPAGTWSPPLRDASAGRRVHERRVVELGLLPAVGVLFSVSASLAWLMRRRSGLR